jgi:hypothetical protein
MRQTAASPSRPQKLGHYRPLASLRDLPFRVEQAVERQAKQCTALFRATPKLGHYRILASLRDIPYLPRLRENVVSTC